MQPDELRIAILQNNELNDLVIEHKGIVQKKSNIYKGRITRVEPSLEAAFVDFGADRQGFLPLKEIPKTYFLPSFSGDLSHINIRDAIKEGQELIIQVDKEERGNKGAALTGFISLAGAYVVLMPNNPRAGGISRRIEGQERDEARDKLPQLQIPEDMGVIIRTAGIGKSIEELQWDLDLLLKQWEAICEASRDRPAPFLIYQESDTVTRTVRDYLRQELQEIIVDDKEVFEKIRQYIQQVKPDFYDKVTYYEKPVPLFSSHQIEKQIETAYQRIVHLPSGGSIVIDHTEALVAIDVNSAKSTSGSDIEETALNTNREAVQEIARQLKLRDIGGLIVIDFIDMSPVRNQIEVSHRLREALEADRARVQVGKISSFGLMEMSRQRLRPHIGEAVQITCPRCDGQGTIRSIESLATSIVHLLEEEALKEKIEQIHVQVPVDLATFILNEKKESLNKIEKLQEIRIIIIPNQHLETPQYKIRSIRKGEFSVKGKAEPSYKFIEEIDVEMPQKQAMVEKVREKPAVEAIRISEKPISVATGETWQHEIPKNKILGRIGKIIKTIFTGEEKKEEKIKPKYESNGFSKKFRKKSKSRYNRRPLKKGHKRYRHEDKKNITGLEPSHSQSAQSPQVPPKSTQHRSIRGFINQNHPSMSTPPSDAYPEVQPDFTFPHKKPEKPKKDEESKNS